MRTLFLAALLIVVTSFATPVSAQSSVYGSLATLFEGTAFGNVLSCLPATGNTCGRQTQYIYSAAIGTKRSSTPLPETKDVLGRSTGPKLLAVQTFVQCPSGTTVGYSQQSRLSFVPQLSAQELAQRSYGDAINKVDQGGDAGQSFFQSLFQPFRQFSSCLSNATHPQVEEGHNEHGGAPAVPTLSSTGQCTAGVPRAITMMTTDPDGDNLRYGVDWNADGTIDQWVPLAGYVPSGTSQTAMRTYAIAGEKSVKVLAQDEGGLSSDWATLTFYCASTLEDDASAGLDQPGTGAGDREGATLLPSAILDLRVIPSLVRTGNSTKINWSSTGMQSCTVMGDNKDVWSALQSPIGGEGSSAITGETTYTLSCLDQDGATHTTQATVRIIPTFQEL